MELTKEECLVALNSVVKCMQYTSCLECDYYNKCLNGNKDLDTLKQLINEHFDNPPLKFEELRERMCIYIAGDINENALIVKICDDLRIEYIYIDSNGFEIRKRVEFEPNSFYRYEVKDVKEN